jgi:hypothetical protein
MAVKFCVYVAAPHACWPHVLKTHDRLRRIGAEPTSAWADQAATTSTREVALTRADAHAALDMNRQCILGSDVIVVLGHPGGVETCCEVGWALAHKRSVLWVDEGQKVPLSVRGDSLARLVASLDEALDAIGETVARLEDT